MYSEKKLIFGLAGSIGCGKSTLAEKLGVVMDLPVHYEEVGKNEKLKEFYKDMKTHSFPLQISLLNARFADQQKLIWNKKGGIQDRTIYEDSIFAKMLHESGLMSDSNYKIYKDLFSNMCNFLNEPTVIIYLRVTPEVALGRIRKRNRDMEKNIDLGYLSSLCKIYEEFINQISNRIPVIIIDWNDPSNLKDPMCVAMKIKEQIHKIHSIHEISLIK